MSDHEVTTMSRTELKSLIEDAYAEGAKALKKELGLDDEYAKIDIEDLRSFLKAWKQMKKEAWKTIVQYCTVAILSALFASIYLQVK